MTSPVADQITIKQFWGDGGEDEIEPSEPIPQQFQVNGVVFWLEPSFGMDCLKLCARSPSTGIEQIILTIWNTGIERMSFAGIPELKRNDLQAIPIF